MVLRRANLGSTLRVDSNRATRRRGIQVGFDALEGARPLGEAHQRWARRAARLDERRLGASRVGSLRRRARADVSRPHETGAIQGHPAPPSRRPARRGPTFQGTRAHSSSARGSRSAPVDGRKSMLIARDTVPRATRDAASVPALVIHSIMRPRGSARPTCVPGRPLDHLDGGLGDGRHPLDFTVAGAFGPARTRVPGRRGGRSRPPGLRRARLARDSLPGLAGRRVGFHRQRDGARALRGRKSSPCVEGVMPWDEGAGPDWREAHCRAVYR